MRVRSIVSLGVVVVAATGAACGETLPFGNDDGVPDSGTASAADAAGDAPRPTDGGPLDGANGDGAGPCAAPSFCVGFESNNAFGEYAKNEGSGGIVGLTTSSPHDGSSALHLVAISPDGGASAGEASVTKVIIGQFTTIACRMWLRAPLGWAGQYDVLSLGTFGKNGWEQWRVAFGVKDGSAHASFYAKKPAAGSVEAYDAAPTAIAAPAGEWVLASFGISAPTWTVTATIGTSTAQAVAPDPTTIADAQMFLGLHAARYDTTTSYELDVDNVRCTVE